MSNDDKRLEKIRVRNFKNAVYPEVCPECNVMLKNNVWTDANKEADLRAWMKNGGRCVRPACNAQLICPECGKPLARNAVECGACGAKIAAPLRTCPRCGEHYDRWRASCPQCGLPSKLQCEQDGMPMLYEEKYCSRCRHYNDWDRMYPVPGAEEPERKPTPLNGTFVITPYGPMFVFDPMPAQQAAPQPQQQQRYIPQNMPAPQTQVDEFINEKPAVVEKKSNNRAVAGLIFSILSILLCPLFPLALIGICLGASGHASRPKMGTAAIILGLIGLVLCAALCLWLFLFGGWNWLMAFFPAKETAALIASIL